MKILCTSDWHLGKKTDGKSRIDEQIAVLDEIFSIAQNQLIDMIIVAGDIFDTFVPSADAESVFYRYAYKFGKVCPFVVVAGNHDDADRLCAPVALAKECNILMFGSGESSFEKDGLKVDENGIVFQKGDDVVSIAVLSYPSESAISLQEGASYSDAVAQKIQEKCKIFSSNGTNMFVSHLFMSGAENDMSDERELGTAKLLSKEILPDCDMVLLGHIHKPMTISNKKRAYYSGSIMPYSFDDISEKRVLIFDTQDKSVQSAPLTKYKKCVRITANTFDEIVQKLDETDDWVEIRYTGEDILPPTAYAIMKKKENFVNIVLPSFVSNTLERRKEATTKELFEGFYEKKKGVKAPENLTDAFLSYMEKAGDKV